MIASDQLPVSYELDSKRYILSKTELRCVDSSSSANNFVIALNMINPNYFIGRNWSPLFILGFIYVLIGVMVSGYRCLTHTADNSDITRLSIFSVVLASFIYRFYREWTGVDEFQFRLLIENKIAFAIPVKRKNREKAQDFVRLLVKRIREAPLANVSTLSLLCSYQLLTQIEMSQLDATIRANQISETTTNPVIIQLKNRTK